MKRNYISVLVAAASMAIVSGNALADDVKSDQPVKDSYITTKVKAELAKDKGTKAHDIHVTTKDGVVMLDGTVSSAAENTRWAACRYAGITKTVVPRTSTGSPVFGSRMSANSCSALSTFVQSTSSFVASKLIHGVLDWNVL